MYYPPPKHHSFFRNLPPLFIWFLNTPYSTDLPKGFFSRSGNFVSIPGNPNLYIQVGEKSGNLPLGSADVVLIKNIYEGIAFCFCGFIVSFISKGFLLDQGQIQKIPYPSPPPFLHCNEKFTLLELLLSSILGAFVTKS